VLPFVAPDLQVDVDDVVVADCEPPQAVVDAEAALLARRAVVPDDAQAVARSGRPERPRRARAAELRAAAGRVLHVALCDGHLVDRIALAERDLAERAAEAAHEGEGDHLVDDDAAVLLHLHGDVGGGEGEGLCRRIPRQRERREDGRR
jgi:hypothetical protein